MAENNSVPESDSDIQLKKRARRRLVGAVALALLAAIVLPMVMDHEPRPPAQDIQVKIPSQEAGSFTSRVLPTKPAPTPLPPAPDKAAEAAVPKLASPPAPEAAKPETISKPETVAKPELPKDSKSAETKAAEKPAKPAEKTAEAVGRSADAARAEKILSGGNETAAGGDGQWVIQLGAYSETGNVKALQAKVKELGYASYTEKVSTPQGDRIRVRAGPFASRDAAEKAQARLKKISAGGPSGGVVAQK